MPGLCVFPFPIRSYQEAKQFLTEGNVIYQTSSPLSIYKKYLMPDGSIYSEFESLLESPEDDYILQKDKEFENEE